MFDTKPYQPPPVDSEEMSFAIALFVAAARGRISPANTAGFSLQQNYGLAHDPLLLGAKAVLQEGTPRLPDEVPLVCAVSVLWHHYEHDARQQAICSRLVAFHALMARRRGAPARRGTQEPADLVEAALSPAIVKAAATAPVGPDGLFADAEFASLVEGFSTSDATRADLFWHKQPTFRPAGAHLTLTEDVQQLSLQLLAFQSCVATYPTGSTPHFRTLEQLCIRIADFSGSATLHAMLSRAWREALPDFRWLQSTVPANARLTGWEPVRAAPTLREAMKCEMAILGFLIELLRTLLGDAVTVQLLRSLWPLAYLGDAPGRLPQSAQVRIQHGFQPVRRTQ